jgi:hypothetical protein
MREHLQKSNFLFLFQGYLLVICFLLECSDFADFQVGVMVRGVSFLISVAIAMWAGKSGRAKTGFLP